MQATRDANGWTRAQLRLARIAVAGLLALHLADPLLPARLGVRLGSGATAVLLFPLALLALGLRWVPIPLLLGALAMLTTGSDGFGPWVRRVPPLSGPCLPFFPWPVLLTLATLQGALLVGSRPGRGPGARESGAAPADGCLPWPWAAFARSALVVCATAWAATWLSLAVLGSDGAWRAATWRPVWAIGAALLGVAAQAARGARPWIWAACAALVLAGSAAGLLLPADSLGMAGVLLLAFDPGWIRPTRAGTTDVLFYDGACGLCHATVRFVLAEDRSGSAFTFAPLGGAAWCDAFPGLEAAPRETVVVRTARGETRVRSAAVLHVARRLGGFWRWLGTLGLLVPRPLGDLAYRAVARVRHRLLPAPTEACPTGSADLARRFDLRPAVPPP